MKPNPLSSQSQSEFIIYQRKRLHRSQTEVWYKLNEAANVNVKGKRCRKTSL